MVTAASVESPRHQFLSAVGLTFAAAGAFLEWVYQGV
jgi:hypothetical protein